MMKTKRPILHLCEYCVCTYVCVSVCMRSQQTKKLQCRLQKKLLASRSKGLQCLLVLLVVYVEIIHVERRVCSPRESERVCFYRRWFVYLSVITRTKRLWTYLYQILWEGF